MSIDKSKLLLLRTILGCLVGAVAFAQSGSTTPQENPSMVHETQVHGYWIDPSTGLMWAGKDNGKAVRWQKAKKYCRNLRLAGYSDWRLATIDELNAIYDKSVEAPGINPPSHWHGSEAITYRVKGNLFLTGDQWSSTQIDDDRGHPTSLVWYFDFLNGVRKDEDTSLVFNLWGEWANALCVRRP